jgi:hypothetical protein
MARVDFKYLNMRIDPTLHEGLENFIDIHNSKGVTDKKLVKVRVIEDLLFSFLYSYGWIGRVFADEYIESMRKRNYPKPIFTVDSVSRGEI